PYLLKEINVPIYGSKLAIAMIKNNLKEHHLLRSAELHVINEDSIIKFRKLSVEFFHTNHSVAESFGIAVQTPYGYVVETGDFKFDFTPPFGEHANLQKMARIGEEGVITLLSDSTNAEIDGFTNSEKNVSESILGLVENIEGRIIFASFASNLSRIQQVIQAAKETGRKVAIFGRSMVSGVEVGIDLGYIKEDPSIFIKAHEIKKYPDNEILMLCTGSQGEPFAALSRIANGTHRQISIIPGDTVMFSSSPIPGNTNSVNNLINNLLEAGAEIIHGKVNNIHTSGHGAKEELKLMLRLMKPKYFMPIHGERRMQHEHVDLAVKTGVEEDNCFILDNGEVLSFTDKEARMAGTFRAGDVYIDGSGIGDIGSVVLSDRRALSNNGLVVVVATIDIKNRKVLAGPDIISRGFIYMRESEDLIRRAKKVAFESLSESFNYKHINEYKMRNDLIEDLKTFLYNETERDPMILPVVLTSD
ncbi:MAG: ribonuclease J, partial [Atopostipes suicloacalis]|nr:ribonuclease J [Atopostipes suicloacalis]